MSNARDKANIPALNFSSTGIDDNATSTAITIDSSERVGIGESSPSFKLDVNGTILAQDEVFADQYRLLDSGGVWRPVLSMDSDDTLIQTGTTTGTRSIFFKTEGTERMRIDSSGNVGIGTSSPSSSYRLSVVGGTGAVVGAFIETTSTDSGHEASIIKRPNSGVLVQFLGSGQVGSITTNGSTTTYGTSSDYRLKENVIDLTNATERLKQLQPKRFNFISDADTTVDGFIAHEVSSVVPEAIHGTKDEVDVDGNPKYQNIDQSKLVPLLVKTIQELEARITTLENA